MNNLTGGRAEAPGRRLQCLIVDLMSLSEREMYGAHDPEGHERSEASGSEPATGHAPIIVRMMRRWNRPESIAT
jgi:hypothetical protein